MAGEFAVGGAGEAVEPRFGDMADLPVRPVRWVALANCSSDSPVWWWTCSACAFWAFAHAAIACWLDSSPWVNLACLPARLAASR